MRAFAFRGNRSGSVLGIRDEMHVRQSQFFAVSVKDAFFQTYRKCFC